MPQRSGKLQVELVRDPGELKALAPAWRSLAVSRSNGFLTPEWFWAWQDHYGADHSPMVAIVRGAAGELRGVLPLVVGQRRRARGARFAGSSLGDHFEILAPDGDERQVARAIGAVLADQSGLWRFLVLENVDRDQWWWRELSAATGCGAPLVDRAYDLPRITLDGRTWEEYLASRSRNFRSQLGRKRRSLERDHRVAVRWTTQDDDVESDMAALFRLHDLRWATRPTGSSLTSPKARAFHTDFSVAAHDQGWLRLGFLEVDAQPAAAWYGWRVGTRFAYYQAGFDPVWSDRSVGLLLFAEAIRAATEERAAEYDMLLGDEPYKQRFADSARQVCTAMIAPRLRPVRMIASGEARARTIARRLPSSVRTPMTSRARGLLDRLPLGRAR